MYPVMADAYKSQLLMSLWCYAEPDHEKKKVSLTVNDLASENAIPLTLKHTHLVVNFNQDYELLNSFYRCCTNDVF